MEAFCHILEKGNGSNVEKSYGQAEAMTSTEGVGFLRMPDS